MYLLTAALAFGLVLAYMAYLPLANAARMSSSAAAVAHQRKAFLTSVSIGIGGAAGLAVLALAAR